MVDLPWTGAGGNDRFDIDIPVTENETMSRHCASLIFLAFTTLVAADDVAADDVVLTFRMHSPGLSEKSEVFIAGNHPGLGNWHPRKIQMKYEGDHVWTHSISVPPGQSIEYKYTLGSWQREGANANGQPMNNLSITVSEAETRRDRIDSWTNRKERKIEGQITGSVRYHRQVTGEGIRPRDVIVWLPENYEVDENRRFPVLYMQDGQNIIDPKTSSFGTDWQIDETCTRLIRKGEIEPLIVVGVYNTPDRSREYLPGEKGTAYMNFLVQTLKPLIDQTYRTDPTRESTYVGGSSAGGMLAFMITWEHPTVFSRAICMSPAFRLDRTDGTNVVDYVSRVEANDRPKQPVFLYIDNGGVGLETRLQPGIDAMLEALREKQFEPKSGVHWLRAPEDHHNESAWARRFPKAIRVLQELDVRNERPTESDDDR